MTVFRILAVLLCVLAVPAYAQVENQDYKKLNPAQPLAATDKVEIIEFFSYACPHCYAMQPHIEKWAAELPANAYSRGSRRSAAVRGCSSLCSSTAPSPSLFKVTPLSTPTNLTTQVRPVWPL